jgi:SpoVK/Ycf46/Vps4 family AAA+-type ATPase
MQTEILKIIEGGLDGKRDKVHNYAVLLASKLQDNGESALAERITKLINKKIVHPVFMDEFVTKPVDPETRLDMVDIFYPEEEVQKLVLSEVATLKINNFIATLKNRNKLVEKGVNLPESLLLYGPPGCGKTSIAKYIASQMKIPLITARLDGLVSSLLGNTAKNIRKIFEYAKEKPCILFLDEFDAIAKARDDEHEIGELKRVVNSLLQNIDDFSKSNDGNVLIAATNHDSLLDAAVWRRFSTTIEVPKPNYDGIGDLLKLYFADTELSFNEDKKKLNKIVYTLSGTSPSDIKTICFNVVRDAVLHDREIISYQDVLVQIYLFKGFREQELSLVKFLNGNGVSQADIAEALNISLRQVRNKLRDEEESYHE